MAVWHGLLVVVLLLLAGCPKQAGESRGGGEESEELAEITNRIVISAEVRRNLGITFVKVEKRRVAETLRIPGRFEALPTARREYPAMLSGRITLLVKQYQTVAAGTPLFRIDSPQWRKMQEELGAASAAVLEHSALLTVLRAAKTEAEAQLELFPARIEALEPLNVAAQAHIEALRASEGLWEERIKALDQLAAKGGGKAAELTEARASLGEVLASVAESAEKLAELDQSRVDLEAERASAGLRIPYLQAQIAAAQMKVEIVTSAYKLALATAAASAGMKVETLRKDDAWREIGAITIRATAAGVIDHLDVTDGTWLESHTEVLGTLDPAQLRFRARALQSDLGLLKDGQAAQIVPPLGGSLAQTDFMTGAVKFSLEADPDERTVDLLVAPDKLASWARLGVAAQLEVIVRDTGEALNAIPVNCVIKDGLEHIFFVRDRDDPNKVIRKVTSLGVSDGRWVVIHKGAMTGSEIVQQGVYELKLTGSGKAGGGGHFHADGTFHPAGTKH